MPSLRRKLLAPIPKPTGVLPAGADLADWVQPVERLIRGLVVYEPSTFVHRDDPVVALAPHLFLRCSDNEPVGPPSQSSLSLAGL